MAPRLLFLCGATAASAMVARLSSHEIQNRLGEGMNVGSGSVSDADGYTQYKDDAYWSGVGGLMGSFKDHVALSYSMLNMVPYSGFSASLVLMPDAMAEKTGTMARYLVSIQHKGSKCGKYGESYVQNVLPQWEGRDLDFILLDEKFKPLRYSLNNIPGRDARLIRVGDQILASYEAVKQHPNHTDIEDDKWWGVVGVHADAEKVCTGNFTLNNTFVHEWWSYVNDSDVGVVAYQESYLLLLRDIASKTDSMYGPMAASLAQQLPSSGGSTTSTSTLDSSGWPFNTWTTTVNPAGLHYQRNKLHNSVNPLYLQESKEYLGVTYAYEGNETSEVQSGTNFVHRFFLMQGETPFAVKSFSGPFCIPSLNPDRAGQCEVIQRIRGLIHDPNQDGMLLVSYGVLDCEAALVRIPLQAVRDALVLPFEQVLDVSQQNFQVDAPL